MKRVIDWMNGRKTYCVAVAVLVLGVLGAFGVEVPEYVYVALSALGLGWLRAGVQKAKHG